jgi:hypothetical protein
VVKIMMESGRASQAATEEDEEERREGSRQLRLEVVGTPSRPSLYIRGCARLPGPPSKMMSSG